MRYESQAGNPDVRGVCPSCGRETLFLGNNGYVTCSVIGCSDPAAASKLLAADRAAAERREKAVRELVEAAEDAKEGLRNAADLMEDQYPGATQVALQRADRLRVALAAVRETTIGATTQEEP